MDMTTITKPQLFFTDLALMYEDCNNDQANAYIVHFRDLKCAAKAQNQIVKKILRFCKYKGIHERMTPFSHQLCHLSL